MMKKTASFLFTVCLTFLSTTGCSGDSTETSPPPPTVSTTSPATGVTGVATDAVVTVTFSEAMDPATINATTFTLKDSAGHTASGAVACNGATATFTPSSALTHLVTYTATITTGARSLAGGALAANHAWSFTVATTPSPLLSAQTLRAWIDDGLVNGTGSNRVVVLDVNTPTTYAAGHISGAHLLNPTDANVPLYQNRQEGPAVDVNMVLDGAHMDALVQKYGIDGHTTVVFTGPILNATRGYWTFRYWGFPKEMLKLLDGLNTTWSATYGLTAEPSPSITPSTYSVKSNASLRDDLRASLSEMMAVAKGDVAGFILDGRSAATTGSYAGVPGSTPGVFGATGDYVVFEGHMNGARALDYTTMFDAATLRFKSTADLTTMFVGVDIDGTKPTYVHCRTGVIAAVPFFILDAILDWPAVDYDGSWSQWGQMSGDASNGGRLAADSPWRTDTAEYSALVVYNHDNPTDVRPVELLGRDGAVCSGTLATTGAITYTPASCTFTEPESDATSGNQIEEADAAYMGH